MNEFSLIKESDTPIQFCRHPFAYLLEAADDTTYTIIDFEDAHRLGILSHDEIKGSFHELIVCLSRPEDKINEIEEKLKFIENENEKISYLRGRAINSLILEASDKFKENITSILNGSFNETLVGLIKKNCNAFKKIEDISYEKIYNHRTVVELELAGYNIMFELLNVLIPSVLLKEGERQKIDKKAIKLIPIQFGPFTDDISSYLKCLGVLDFISGMTDNYGTELYRKIKGIEIGKHS